MSTLADRFRDDISLEYSLIDKMRVRGHQMHLQSVGMLSLGTVIRAYDTVMSHTCRRLRRWLCYKHDVRRGKYARFPRKYLHDELHLVKLKELKRSPLWANAW